MDHNRQTLGTGTLLSNSDTLDYLITVLQHDAADTDLL